MADLRSSVVGDLRALAGSDLENGDEGVLRDASARLRRLLLDGGGTLMRYRRALGLRGEPRVECFGLAAPDDGLAFAQSGGAKRGGMTVAGIQVWNRILSDEEIRERYEAGKSATLPDATRPMSTQRARLSEWLSSKCMIVAGVSVTRRDVVQFVANKLGGVHLDSRRDPTKQPGYVALDTARSTMGTMDLDVVYAELASITQDFLASPEVRTLFPDE
ncbi:MAG TPA: hypothetical protein VGR26_04035 [Acidimicrobiales bacterium]|nr:hypothetical protein [Acidimicrobiales bacterium]